MLVAGVAVHRFADWLLFFNFLICDGPKNGDRFLGKKSRRKAGGPTLGPPIFGTISCPENGRHFCAALLIMPVGFGVRSWSLPPTLCVGIVCSHLCIVQMRLSDEKLFIASQTGRGDLPLWWLPRATVTTLSCCFSTCHFTDASLSDLNTFCWVLLVVYYARVR